MSGDTVVVAIDGSEFSDYALQFYVESIHKPDNRVILAHSVEYKFVSYPAVSVMSGDTNMSSVTREIQEEEEKSKALEEKMKHELEKLKIEAEIYRLRGDAGHAIVQLANEKAADFIVVGCRGKGSVRRTFTGSVTDFIVHHSHVPVIVARHKDHIKHHQHHHGFHLNPFHTSHHHHHDKHENHGKGTPPLQRKN